MACRSAVVTTVAMRAVRLPSRAGPIVLVPWATSVLTDSPDPDEGPTTLLDLDQGRIFRFCPNNQTQADLVVSCLVHDDPKAAPDRAHFIVDRNDPYAEDLADSFHRTLERRFTNVELVEHADTIDFPGLMTIPGIPGPLEDALAESICRDVERGAPGRETWIVLPLQQEPALRMLLAIRRHARQIHGKGGSPLRVVCGDGIGVETLTDLAKDCPFPVWGFSAVSPAVSVRAAVPAPGNDAQVSAEIVSAVALCLDVPRNRPLGADMLRDALAALRIKPDDRAAFGRSLAFTPSGERQGADVGQVLTIRPGERTVLAFARTGDGRWSAPVPVPPASVAKRP